MKPNRLGLKRQTVMCPRPSTYKDWSLMAKFEKGDLVEVSLDLPTKVTAKIVDTCGNTDCCLDVEYNGRTYYGNSPGDLKFISRPLPKPKPGTLVGIGGSSWRCLTTDADETWYVGYSAGAVERGCYGWSELATNPKTRIIG